MAKVIFGNHAAVVVPRQDRDRIRRFYCDVLGFRTTRETDDKDDFQLGEDDYFHLSILYGDFADESEFLRSGKSIYLELKSDDVEAMRQKITGAASSCSTCRIPTSTSRLQEDRCSGSSESTRTSRSMSGTLRVTSGGTQDLLPRRAGEPSN